MEIDLIKKDHKDDLPRNKHLSWAFAAQQTLLGLICCGFTSLTFSWNAVGHRVIAQIAYDQLSKHQKWILNRYNRAVDSGYFSKNMVNSSIWMDVIRYRMHDYDAMHYIDIPFSDDKTKLPEINPVNAIFAINAASDLLSSPHATPIEKGIALRILVHVTGDVHQPLHTASRISSRFPEGDRGGNLVVIKNNKISHNLHGYWDKGAGLLVGKPKLGQAWVKRQAIIFEQEMPCNSVDSEINPMHWAQESNAWAIQYAYKLPANGQLDWHYQRLAQQIVRRQMALAGCRLAMMLKRVA